MNAVVKPSLDDLAARWVEAKRQEAAANATRVGIEAEIIALTGLKEEGSETHATPAGRKITVTGKLTYKVDVPALITLAAELPDMMRPLKTQTVADEAGLKFLRANEAALWRVIAPAIEIKPAKPSVVIKEA